MKDLKSKNNRPDEKPMASFKDFRNTERKLAHDIKKRGLAGKVRWDDNIKEEPPRVVDLIILAGIVLFAIAVFSLAIYGAATLISSGGCK